MPFPGCTTRRRIIKYYVSCLTDQTYSSRRSPSQLSQFDRCSDRHPSLKGAWPLLSTRSTVRDRWQFEIRHESLQFVNLNLPIFMLSAVFAMLAISFLYKQYSKYYPQWALFPFFTFIMRNSHVSHLSTIILVGNLVARVKRIIISRASTWQLSWNLARKLYSSSKIFSFPFPTWGSKHVFYCFA